MGIFELKDVVSVFSSKAWILDNSAFWWMYSTSLSFDGKLIHKMIVGHNWQL